MNVINEKKRKQKSLNRIQALEKCRKMEEDIQNALAGARKYTTPTSKRIPVIDPQIEKDFRHPDVAEKVQEWIMPRKIGKKNPEQMDPFKSMSSSMMAGDYTLVGPKRTGTGISEVLKKSSNNITTTNKFLKEFGEQHPMLSPSRHLWNWGSEKFHHHPSNVKPQLEQKPTTKTEIKPQDNPLPAEDKELTAEEDAKRVKRIMAKEKRMKLKQARMQWERDNEIKRSSHKPKDAFGDMFYVPVPENRINPQEFKNNYAKYIADFENKLQQKITQKFNNNSGDVSQRPQHSDRLKETYLKLLEEAKKRGLAEKLGMVTNVGLYSS